MSKRRPFSMYVILDFKLFLGQFSFWDNFSLYIHLMECVEAYLWPLLIFVKDLPPFQKNHSS